MGYSTPKKQLDLKDFLSQPGKKVSRRSFGYRSVRETTPDPEDQSPASDDASSGDTGDS